MRVQVGGEDAADAIIRFAVVCARAAQEAVVDAVRYTDRRMAASFMIRKNVNMNRREDGGGLSLAELTFQRFCRFGVAQWFWPHVRQRD